MTEACAAAHLPPAFQALTARAHESAPHAGTARGNEWQRFDASGFPGDGHGRATLEFRKKIEPCSLFAEAKAEASFQSIER